MFSVSENVGFESSLYRSDNSIPSVRLGHTTPSPDLSHTYGPPPVAPEAPSTVGVLRRRTSLTDQRLFPELRYGRGTINIS